MDFETFIESLLRFVRSGDNAYFVTYAAATCALTQAAKKLFVNKVKVDVLHKFDLAVILPFIFGLIFAVADVFAVKRSAFCVKAVTDSLINGAAIGALASTIFKLITSFSGQKLSKLMTDDAFGMFYTQLMYYGNVREQLLSGELNLKQFLSEAKLLAANALDIYKTDIPEEDKRQKLAALLTGIIDDNSVNACVNVLNKALVNYVAQKNVKSRKKKDA